MRNLYWLALTAIALASCAPAAAAVTPPPGSAAIRLISPAFTDGQPIPVEFTCQGKNTSPALSWTGIPGGAKSLALVVEDPDAPSGTYTHWVLANLPPTLSGLDAGAPAPQNAQPGSNSSGKTGYTGPCPPAGKVHHYIFTLYALDQVLNFAKPPSRTDLLAALEGHVLASGRLTGTYQR